VFSRASSKLLPTLAIAAFLALGLAACGGGDDTTGSATGATTGGEKEPGSSDSGSERGSASFLVPGGDNSIQEFGEEADSAELEEAEEALGAYLEARANEDWAKSCGYLAEEALTPLEQLAKASPQLKGADCGQILAKLQASTPTSEEPNPMTDGLAALRVEDDRGFALFHGAKGTDYFILLSKRDDGWAVAALAPSEFP
jgi:hypothetical protein